MRENPSPPAYQVKKLKEYLERIAGYADYAKTADIKDIEQARAMFYIVKMSAEAALERFEDSDTGY